MDPGEYCREIESYLTRKNDGHLIRIVGPAFERVHGWVRQGVPLKVAFEGIDRCFARYYARGPRRRPVRIEFCEADVLDVFDAWRRAVGLAREHPGTPADQEERPRAPGRERGGLARHLDRVIAKLTGVRAGARLPPVLELLLDETVRQLDVVRGTARGTRGAARQELIERLADLDVRLGEAAVAACDAGELEALRVEAARELEPFGGRLAPAARAEAHRRLVVRLARARFDLPVLAFE